MTYARRGVGALALLFSLIWAPAELAVAQTSLSVRLQPAIIEDRVDPGQRMYQILRVTNQGATPQTFYLVARDIRGLNEEGQPIFAEEGTGAYGLKDWVFFDKTQLTVKPGETKEVPVEIRVPEGALPGGHFGGVFVATEPARLAGTVGSGVGAEIGTIISLRISGEVIEEARIREFHTEKSLYSKPDIKFSVKVENLGNVLIRPRGPLEIQDMFGKQVAALIVNNEGSQVFPRSERTFEAAWTGSGLAFGRYQAIVSLVYGEDGRKSISHAVSFWVLPLKEIATLLLAIVLLIGGFYLWLRAYIRRKISELGGNASGRKVDGPAEPPSRLIFLAIGVILCTLAFVGILFLLFS